MWVLVITFTPVELIAKVAENILILLVKGWPSYGSRSFVTLHAC